MIYTREGKVVCCTTDDFRNHQKTPGNPQNRRIKRMVSCRQTPSFEGRVKGSDDRNVVIFSKTAV